MPCSDGNRLCDGTCNTHSLNEVKRLRLRNDKLAQMLCALCGVVEKEETKYKGISPIRRIPGLRDWWEAHQKEDREREEKERQAKRSQRLKEEAQLHELAKKLGKRVI